MWISPGGATRAHIYHKSLVVFIMFTVRALVGAVGSGRRRRLAKGMANEEEDPEDEDVLDSDAVRERHRALGPSLWLGRETKSLNTTVSWSAFALVCMRTLHRRHLL